MSGNTQSATIRIQRTSVTIPALLTAALLVGGLGGYALRATAIPTAQAQTAAQDSGTVRTVLIPRSAREDNASAAAQRGPTNVLFLASEHQGSPENPDAR